MTFRPTHSNVSLAFSGVARIWCEKGGDESQSQTGAYLGGLVPAPPPSEMKKCANF